MHLFFRIFRVAVHSSSCQWQVLKDCTTKSLYQRLAKHLKIRRRHPETDVVKKLKLLTIFTRALIQ